MKKNKKTILIAAGGGGLLVVTSVAIVIPVVLTSSNSDQQAIKEAQAALEKLTNDQKTVDLTKAINQKLPSAFKITSMETLNALLKKVITILDGITYTPQIIKTNNAKGEIVVEIEMQKGAVRATVNFTIVGFTTTSQVQANLEAALAKVDEGTISGDGNQLPSSMDSTSIGTLKGFPQAIANGVHFSATPKIPIDAAGTLVIILTATKGAINKAKELTIRGFKTQNDQVAINKALTKIVTNTISGDKNKLPSQMTTTLIKALTSFPKTTSNGVSFNVAIKNNGVDDDKGQLIIILTATKGSSKSKAKELTISDFQTQAQADQIAIDNEIKRKFTISANSTRLPSQMTPSLIKALTGFPKTTSNGVSFSVAIKNSSVDDDKGQLVVILTATKGSSKSKAKELTISGFQIQVQADQIVVDNEIKKGFTISGDNNKLPSQMNPTLIKTLTGFPVTTPNDVHFSVVIKSDGVDDDKGQLVVILTAIKGSSKSKTKELTISGFKISAQAKTNQEDVDAEIEKSFTISGDNNKLPSQMNPTLIKALVGFPAAINDVHFSVVIKRMVSFIGDGEGELEFTLIASKGKQSASKNIIISGFKSRELSQEEKGEKDVVIMKNFLNLFRNLRHKNPRSFDLIFADKYTIFYNSNITIWVLISNSSSYLMVDDETIKPKNFSEIVKRTILTYDVIIDPQDDTAQIITVTISSKTTKAMATSTIIVSGFKSRKLVQSKIDDAKTLLDGFYANINSDTKTAAQVTYKDINDFIAKTTTSLNTLDQAIIKQVTIAIETIPKGDTSQSVTFTISKDGGKSMTSTIEISGFASQKLETQKTIISELKKITKATITGDTTQFPSEMTPTLIKKLSDFPSTASGVSFDVKVKTLTNIDGTSTDISGTLIIILTGSKNGVSRSKELTISGFKKQSLSQNESDVANALAQITKTTITGDSAKLPSEMDSDSIKTLSGFPTTSNSVSFDVKVKTLFDIDGTSTDISGTLIITLTATKGKSNKNKELTISGFKTRSLSQDESDVANELDKITKATITGDSTNLPSKVNAPTLIKKLKGFPSPTNDVSFDVIVSTTDINDEEGTLIVTLIASKNGVSKNKDLIIEGFKTQVQIDQDIIDNYQKLIKKISQTTTTKINKLSSAITYDNVPNFNVQTNVNLDLPPANVNVVITTKNADGSQVVTFTITKGKASTTHQIIVSGFKIQAQANIDEAKRVLDKLDEHNTIDILSKDDFATNVTYDNLRDLFEKTTLPDFDLYGGASSLLEVTITIKAVPKGDRSQTVTLIISKLGGITTKSTIEVTGFKSQS